MLHKIIWKNGTATLLNLRHVQEIELNKKIVTIFWNTPPSINGCWLWFSSMTKYTTLEYDNEEKATNLFNELSDKLQK